MKKVIIIKNILIALLLVLVTLLYSVKSYAQFESDVRLTNNSSSSETSNNNAWCIAANGSTVHAVWSDNRFGSYEIYYKRSTDDGTTWSSDLALTSDTALSRSPSIAVSGNFVHIVWVDRRNGNENRIYYKRSTNSGASWSSSPTIFIGTTVPSDLPSISVSGASVCVIWQKVISGNLLNFRLSTDDGNTWGTNFNFTGQIPRNASISASLSNVTVVWNDFSLTTSRSEIFYRTSTDGGINWGSNFILSSISNTAESHFPSISTFGSLMHVVWRDTINGNNEIRYRRSTNGGITWLPEMLLSSVNSVSARDISIASSGSVVHIVWRDQRDGNSEIYYKRSQDSGATWGADTRLTNNSGSSLFPSVAISGTIVHVVWNDNRDGNTEIYYKRDLTGSVLPVNMNFFNSTTSKNNVTLKWQTSSEINNKGFEILRKKEDEKEYNLIGWVDGNGTISQPRDYSYSDSKLNTGKYQYKLKQIDYNGNFEYFQLQEQVNIGSPSEFFVSQNYPNPSNPKCRIDYQIPFDGKVNIIVYDVTGREVTTLLDGYKTADYYTAEFDGTNLSSGAYFYRIIAESGEQKFSKTNKMILVK